MAAGILVHSNVLMVRLPTARVTQVVRGAATIRPGRGLLIHRAAAILKPTRPTHDTLAFLD